MSPDDRRFEIYKLLFENWRFQVKSNWDRSSYFALFETAALVGVWRILETQSRLSLGLPPLGSLLTLVWTLSNHKSGHYGDYWWHALARIETEGFPDSPSKINFVSQYDANLQTFRFKKLWPSLNYSMLMQCVPMIFSLVWAGLIIKGLRQIEYGNTLESLAAIGAAFVGAVCVLLQGYLLGKAKKPK